MCVAIRPIVDHLLEANEEERYAFDPKDGELYVSNMKPQEIEVEV